MKITQHKTVTHGTCLPPEAYIHLWKAAAKANIGEVLGFKSTVYPTKK
jgi:hypothetical protein